MTHIHNLVNELADEGLKSREIENLLGVSASMVSAYKKSKGYNASLAVAKRVYQVKGLVLHPFSKESIIYEIGEE